MSEPSNPGVITGLPPGAFSSLLRSLDGLRNGRALAALLGCTTIGVLVATIFTLLAAHLGWVFGFLGGVSVLLASAAGISAAGVLLMDQARGLPSRSLVDALVYGLMCLPKFILLALTLWAVGGVVFLVIAVAFLVCRIPVLGPILFVGVFPVSVLAMGLTVGGLTLCMVLALPAIWEGAPILRALTQAIAVARHRFVETLLMLFVVSVLAGAVGFVACSVLFAGLVPTLTLAASVFGGEGPGSMLGGLHVGTVAAESGSYGLAAGIGGMLLWALAGTLVSVVSLLGLNIVFLRVTQGLDVGALETVLKLRFGQARRQAADLGQKAREAAERAREQARLAAASATRRAGPQPPGGTDDASDATLPLVAPGPRDGMAREAPPESTTPAVAKALTCPQCLSAVAKGDVFCAVCGSRI